MLFALSPMAEQALERDFARHVVERVYHAVVGGSLTEKRTFDSYFVRDRGDGLRGSSPLGAKAPEAQHAITHVTPLEPLPGHTLVECRLETGRTHQIRIHLSEAGHPLAGEKTYTPSAPSDIGPRTSDMPPPPRHFLHSHRLRFTHPATGKPLEYVSTYPKDLAGWLKKLRLSAPPRS
jgi:23S rRNA pseudouridine1911/1915/1917 synthase